MPNILSFSDLSYTTPDGRVLLEKISFSLSRQRVGLVGDNGVGKSTLLKLIAGQLSPRSGAVHVDGTLSMLSQSVSLRDRATIAEAMGVGEAFELLKRCFAGEGDMHDLERVDWSLEERCRDALLQVGLSQTALNAPFYALSGGQQTRVQLAGLLVQAPDMVLLDEPTNHLDADGRRFVAEFIQGWAAGLLVASHDRSLLENVDSILELSELGVQLYGGAYSAYQAAKDAERQRAEQNLVTARNDVARVKRQLQLASERKAKRDAAGKRSRPNAGQPKMLLDAAKERAEQSGGALSKLKTRQKAEMDDRLEAAKAAVEHHRDLNFAVQGSAQHASKVILAVDGVSGGYKVQNPIIRNVSMAIYGAERVAIEGANGAGKSTLLKLISGALPAQSGTVQCHVPSAYLDQNCALLDHSLTLLENFRQLNGDMGDRDARAALARFFFRNEQALRLPSELSGGERLRAALACVIGGNKPVGLLMLDEPTNHLDLQSVEAIEEALSTYQGALLVVSHDAHFKARIRVRRRIALSP